MKTRLPHKNIITELNGTLPPTNTDKRILLKRFLLQVKNELHNIATSEYPRYSWSIFRGVYISGFSTLAAIMTGWVAQASVKSFLCRYKDVSTIVRTDTVNSEQGTYFALTRYGFNFPDECVYFLNQLFDNAQQARADYENRLHQVNNILEEDAWLSLCLVIGFALGITCIMLCECTKYKELTNEDYGEALSVDLIIDRKQMIQSNAPRLRVLSIIFKEIIKAIMQVDGDTRQSNPMLNRLIELNHILNKTFKDIRPGELTDTRRLINTEDLSPSILSSFTKARAIDSISELVDILIRILSIDEEFAYQDVQSEHLEPLKALITTLLETKLQYLFLNPNRPEIQSILESTQGEMPDSLNQNTDNIESSFSINMV